MKRLLTYLKPHKWIMTAATTLVLFIIVACLLIWGVDLIAALIKNSLGIPVISKLINLL